MFCNHIIKQIKPQIRSNHIGLPYLITMNEAQKIFHKNNKFPEGKGDNIIITQEYLPFSYSDVTNFSCEYNARYGIEKKRTEIIIQMNSNGIIGPALRTCYDVFWYNCDNLTTKLDSSKGETFTQIYTGLQYSNKAIEKISQTENLIDKLGVIKFCDPEMFKTPMLHELYIKNKVNKIIKKILESKCRESFVKQYYNADRHEIVNIIYNDNGKIELCMYYMPVFVCCYTIMGLKYYKFINGYDGRISGRNTFGIKQVVMASLGVGVITSYSFTYVNPLLFLPMFKLCCIITALPIIIAFINNIVKSNNNIKNDKREFKNKKFASMNNYGDSELTEIKYVLNNDFKPEKVDCDEIENKSEISEKYPENHLNVLGLNDTNDITKEVLLIAKNKQLDKWNKTNYNGSRVIADIYIDRINESYKVLSEYCK